MVTDKGTSTSAPSYSTGLNPDSASSSPYTLSASAARRAKRKSKTELTGGSLSALNLALAATPTAAPTAEDDDEEEDEEEWYGEEWEGTSRRAKKEANRKAKAAAAFDEGKIGEGKGKQMSAKARGKALYVFYLSFTPLPLLDRF